MEQEELSLLVEMQNSIVTLGNTYFLTKLNILLPYDPTIGLLGINPKELKTYPHKIYAGMFLPFYS